MLQVCLAGTYSNVLKVLKWDRNVGGKLSFIFKIDSNNINSIFHWSDGVILLEKTSIVLFFNVFLCLLLKKILTAVSVRGQPTAVFECSECSMSSNIVNKIATKLWWRRHGSYHDDIIIPTGKKYAGCCSNNGYETRNERNTLWVRNEESKGA